MAPVRHEACGVEGNEKGTARRGVGLGRVSKHPRWEVRSTGRRAASLPHIHL
jgi:hypothetical protein